MEHLGPLITPSSSKMERTVLRRHGAPEESFANGSQEERKKSGRIRSDATLSQKRHKTPFQQNVVKTDEPKDKAFFINDKTITWPTRNWSSFIPSNHTSQILLTNYGWNLRNQQKGLSYARSLRSTLLLEGILKHPYFNPADWTGISSKPTNLTTYVFLDVEMCFELNWPHYGGETGYVHFKGGLNVDVVGNRSTTLERDGDCCQFQNYATSQPIFKSPHVRLILLDCSGRGMTYCCLDQRDKRKTTVVSISASTTMQSKHDLGLPPPAAQPLALSLEQIYNVETCNEESRPLLYTFAGAIYNRGDVRPKLKRLHNGNDVLVVRHTKMVNMTYSEFMTKSKFAGTPKGDNLFSYRFTEAMSAGAIPVVHADNWALPFSSKLIDWSKCVVVIPEAQVNETISILFGISDGERCAMRKCVLNTYQKYMSTPEATIAGIITSLEPE